MITTSPLAISKDRRWQRAIIKVKLGTFYAAVEQLENPLLTGRPIVLTRSDQDTYLLSCSTEAQARGIRNGMWLPEAKRLCPELIRVTARPPHYATISAQLLAEFRQLTPEIEAPSLGEFFLDVTHVQRVYGAPPVIARRVQRLISDLSGLRCSLGVAGDKTTAGWAAKQPAPAGLTVIPPWETATRLRDVPVRDLCGLGRGISAFLASRGVRTCHEMRRLPVSILTNKWGNIGQHIWLMTQGQDPEPVKPTRSPHPSVGCGQALPAETHEESALRLALEHSADAVATRLREQHQVAQQFYIGLRTEQGWRGGRFLTEQITDDGPTIRRLCRTVLSRCWQGEDIHHIQVTALDPTLTQLQLKLPLEDGRHGHSPANPVVHCRNRRSFARVTAHAPVHGRLPLGEGMPASRTAEGYPRIV